MVIRGILGTAAVIAGLTFVVLAPEAQASPASQANAVRAAKGYLDMQGFSHAGLVKQLEYEGYTPSRAEYGVEGAGL